MLILIKKISKNVVVVRLGLAIATSFLLANSYVLSTNAQTNSLEASTENNYSDGYLEGIGTGETNWDFSSEQESLSLEDKLKELPEFSIFKSEPDSELDLELVEENPRGDNLGNSRKYLLETEIYDY